MANRRIYYTPIFSVVTDHPVAIHSRDHIHPHGTINDNSRWHKFNEKMYELKAPHQVRVMDLGCSGGAFVKDCIDDGNIAIGLEGSDWSMLSRRAEWATIPDNLFTCDITKPFQVMYSIDGDETLYPMEFDFITGWELMEHIPEQDLPAMLENCKKHLAPGGKMIFSVSPNEEYWHVCVHDKDWWVRMFLMNGLYNREDLVQHFGDDWIRGPKQGAPNSFHVVLEKAE